MMSESPTAISAGRPASTEPVALKTILRKATCAVTSLTTMRGMTERYPARGGFPDMAQVSHVRPVASALPNGR